MNFVSGEEDNLIAESLPSSECSDNDRYIKGPPFNPKDYMISPSDSVVSTNKEPVASFRTKLCPADLKVPAFDLDARKALIKLKTLLQDEFGKNEIKRQKNLLQIINKGTPLGFLVEDICHINEIMEQFAFNHKSVPDYVEMMNVMLKIVVNPPRMTKTSEVMNFKTDLSYFFTILGEILTIFEDPDIQFQVLDILNSLLIRRKPQDIACVKLLHCLSAMEDSLLPFTVASLLETVPEKLYLHYLEICQQITLISEKACFVMIHCGVIEFILWRLNPYFREKYIAPIDMPSSTKSDEEFSENCEILQLSGRLLMALLTVITEHSISCKSPTQNALWSLRYAFHAESKKQTRKDVAIRNNLAAIIVKLYAVFGEKLPLVQSGLACGYRFPDVAMLAVATEIGTKNSWAEDINFGTSEDDFMLKKMMLGCCCDLAKVDGMTEILRNQKVMEGILRLINPGLTPLSVHWSPSQFFYLLIIALPILSELVPVLPDIYVFNKGNTRILMALDWFMEEHFDRNLLLETLKTLCTIVTCENNSIIIEDLREQGGIKRLLNSCFYIFKSKALKRDHQEQLTRIFIILNRLCKNEAEVQGCVGNMYVTASIKFLRRIVNARDEDSVLNPRLIICFAAFLWESVAWCGSLLKSFTEQNGVYLLLDLIEKSSYPIRIICIGVLVDMADKGEILTHLLTWRDKDGYGLLNTMIEIWKEEELLHKVPRTQDGCIADVERVLMSEEQWLLTKSASKEGIFSPAIAEMICKVRPKIHALYQLLVQRYGEETKLNETLYSIRFNVVKPENEVYIPLIEHFFAVKLGEMWFEVYQYVVGRGVIPSSFDGETLSTLMEQRNKWACRLKTMQEEIVTFQKLKASKNEDKLYSLIKSSCLASSLDALHELDYIARTTCKKIQMAKRSAQLKEIDDSVDIPVSKDAHIHRTVLHNSNVTFISGKCVWFKSETEAILKSDITEPVSSDSSDCNEFAELSQDV